MFVGVLAVLTFLQITKLIDENIDFIMSVIQPMMTSSCTGNYALDEYISQLVQVAESKLINIDIPKMLSAEGEVTEKTMLPHLAFQAQKFDSVLWSKYSYVYSESGLTYWIVIRDQKACFLSLFNALQTFSRWVSAELDAAIARFQDIRQMNLLELSYGTTIPQAAQDFVALWENLSSRYSGLRQAQCRLLFFEKIQTPLALDCFLDHVSSIAREMDSMFSAIVAQRTEESVKRVSFYCASISALKHVHAFLLEASESDVCLIPLITCSSSWRWKM